MVVKNRDAESIIKLLFLGYKKMQIVHILNLKKQKLSYWDKIKGCHDVKNKTQSYIKYLKSKIVNTSK